MSIASRVTSKELMVGHVVLLNKKQIMIVVDLVDEGIALFVNDGTVYVGSLYNQRCLFTDEELIVRL